MSDTKIPLAGVIGHPISHSRSPALHGHWLQRYGIRGFYVPMDVASDDLQDVLLTLPKMGFRGVNITIPHKEKALGVADIISDRAALIGAANTLTFLPDGKIYADNTDGHGFISNLRQQAPGWNSKSGVAVVLGAGGASRAIISALIEAGVSGIMLSNRTRARAQALRSEFGAKITVVDWNKAGAAFGEADLVVNTTSLGMVGKPEMRIPLDALRKGTVVTDIVYTPLHTAFLTGAQERGCQVVDGLGMLLHQAVPGFERWFGHTPEVDEDLRNAVLGA